MELIRRLCFWRYCGDVFRLCLCASGGESYPSNGGIIDFFRRGLGNGVFSLALSLLYLLTLAVSIAMVARAFLGAYAVQFLHEGSQEEHRILLRVGDHCGDDAFQSSATMR